MNQVKYALGLVIWAFCVLLVVLGPLGWFVLGLLLILLAPFWSLAVFVFTVASTVREAVRRVI